jgi:hypothetical protein
MAVTSRTTSGRVESSSTKFGGVTGARGSDVLDAKLVSAPRREFIELRLGGPDNLVLQHLYQPVD